MVAQRVYSTNPSKSGRKPTKAQQRATRDLANKQAAWDSTYGPKPVKPAIPPKIYDDNGNLLSIYDDNGKVKPGMGEKKYSSPFARPEPITFESTDYERRTSWAVTHPHVNYLAMSEHELEQARKLPFSNKVIIDSAWSVVRMIACLDVAIKANVNDASLAIMQCELTQLKRAYASATLQDKIDESFIDRNNDERDILSSWRYEHDPIIDSAIVECRLDQAARYAAIETTLGDIRKNEAKQAGEPDHDLNTLRAACRKVNRDSKLDGHVLPENLQAALKMVKLFVPSRPSLKVLGNTCISSQPGMIEVQATNLEIGIKVTVKAAQTVPYINTTVDCKTFAEYIALEDTNLPISLLQWYGGLSIMQRNVKQVYNEKNKAWDYYGESSHHATFKTIQASEFPCIPDSPAHFATILDTKQFKSTAKLLASSTYKENDRRPILTGVYLECRDHGFYMAASDSYKLVERNLLADIPGTAEPMIIPGHTLATLAKILPDETIVNVARSDKQVFFTWDNCTVVSSLIDGKFPVTSQIVPTKFDSTCEVDLDKLHTALKASRASHTVTVNVKHSYYDGIDFTLTDENGTTASLECTVNSSFTMQFETKRIASVISEIVKANPRGTVAGLTKSGKATRKKDTSPRMVTLKYNRLQNMIVVDFAGSQNTLCGIRPDPELHKPMTYNPARDNDYTWQGDTNDYTAEQNRYSPIGEKPMYLLPANVPETKRETLKGIARLQASGWCGPHRIESSGVIYLAASYTSEPDPTGWYRRSLQQVAQAKTVDTCAVCGQTITSNIFYQGVHSFHTGCWVQREQEIRTNATKPVTCAICEQEITGKIVHQNGHALHEECYTRMNAYNDRVEARYTRLLNAANRAKAESEAGWKRGHDMASVIPFGQPILVGHHSEQRDRNYRERIHRTFEKAHEQYQRAERLSQRAEAARKNRAISSDDPAAVVKLKEKLAELEALQERMKTVNATIKKVLKPDQKKLAEIKATANPGALLYRVPTAEEHKAWNDARSNARKATREIYTSHAAELAKLIGVTESFAIDLLIPDDLDRIGYPAYELTNNSANIRRIKQRIEDMSKLREKQATQENTETQHGDITIVRNIEANRLQIVFPSKPSKTVIAELKSRGFHWSRNEGAWQRMLSNGAEFAAECVLKAAGVSIPTE